MAKDRRTNNNNIKNMVQPVVIKKCLVKLTRWDDEIKLGLKKEKQEPVVSYEKLKSENVKSDVWNTDDMDKKSVIGDYATKDKKEDVKPSVEDLLKYCAATKRCQITLVRCDDLKLKSERSAAVELKAVAKLNYNLKPCRVALFRCDDLKSKSECSTAVELKTGAKLNCNLKPCRVVQFRCNANTTECQLPPPPRGAIPATSKVENMQKSPPRGNTSERKNGVKYKKELRGIPSIPCELCGAMFLRQSQLLPHMQRHLGEKPFKCSKCPKEFAVKASLTIHFRTHTGERPYKCSTCGKCFAQSPALTAHMILHTNERPFICHSCGTGFRARCHLRTHVLDSGERVRVCKICQKTKRP